MTVGVAAGCEQRYLALAVDTEKAVGFGHRVERVGRHGQVAVGAVFEAHGGGQAAGHFPVGLGLGGAGADRTPGDEILQVLWRDRIQCLGGGGHPQFQDIQQQAPADVQALLELEGVIQVRVVDQPFPAHRSARLLEIDAHHDVQRIVQLRGQRAQAAGVIHGGHRVVNGAGADHHEQAVVLAIQDVANDLATVGHGRAHRIGHRQGLLQLQGREQHFLRVDVDIVYFDIAHRYLPDRVVHI